MADPTRKQIMDEVLTALATIASVAFVSESIVHWEELDRSKFPALFPIDEDERKAPYVLTMSAVNNKISKLRLRVTGYVYDKSNQTRSARCTIMQAVEKRLCYEASALLSLVHSIEPTNVITDKGSIECYSIWDQEFEIEYLYNYADGG